MTLIDRLLGRPSTAVVPYVPPTIKAATGPGVYDMTYLPSLMGSMGKSPQDRMAAYLKAYKVGWFYKAESKIASDIAGLKVSVSHEDNAGDNEAQRIEPDLFAPWEQLDPIGQFLRLMERPNPAQTGRMLRQKTQIRIDMAGAAFWYLEGVGAGFPLPRAIYGISPSRMWPSVDRQSGVLLGWVMDRNRPGGGVPFEPAEILHFQTPSGEDDVFGVGVVESVYHETPLTEAMARHVTDLLATGGRMAGMLWPKDRTLDEAEFTDAQRAWRNVTSDPNAAKRLLIFPEPMEYASGASTPAEIGIPELADLNRDNILTAFPISPYQLGVPVPGGLNSALTRSEDRHDYWEGTIHPRVEMLEETIQIGLLSRYEMVTQTTWDFDIAEPNLDNAEALIAKTGALQALIDLGFDPKESVSAVALDHIKYLGPKPVPAPLAAFAAEPQPAPEPPQLQVVKAAELERDRVVIPAARLATHIVHAFLTEQASRITGNVRSALESVTKTAKGKGDKAARAAAIKADPEWWDSAAENARLAELMGAVYVEVGRGGLQTVANDLNRFIRPGQIDPVIRDLREWGGQRIAAINKTTRKAVVDALAEGTRRGYSIPQLIEGVAADGYRGIRNLTLDNGVEAFSDLRAETIARTETMLSYNRSTITGYGTFGVERLLAYDGDGDLECAARNGQDFPIDEALGIEDHPNGTLVWSPLLKSVEVDHAEAYRELATKAVDALSVQPTINVHNSVTQPDVRIDMAPITIPVTVEPATVSIPPTIVNVDANRTTTKTIERDKNGAITRIVEES